MLAAVNRSTNAEFRRSQDLAQSKTKLKFFLKLHKYLMHLFIFYFFLEITIHGNGHCGTQREIKGADCI